jgi:hypothetical protein
MPADPPLPTFPGPAASGQAPAADVQFATVPELPDMGAQDTAGDDSAGYLGVGMTVEVLTDEGLGMAPPAAAAGSAPAAFLRVNAGWAVKVVSYAAVRTGQKPAVPSPRPAGDNEVLLSRQYALFMPQPALSGEVVYGVAVRYVYGLQVMPGLDDPLDFGTSPLLNVPAALNTLNPADYTTRFLTPPSTFTADSQLQVPGPVSF